MGNNFHVMLLDCRSKPIHCSPAFLACSALETYRDFGFVLTLYLLNLDERKELVIKAVPFASGGLHVI
jgi:hypothetical protein